MFKIYEVLLEKEKQQQIDFLEQHNLDYEYDITYSIVVKYEKEIVATASLANNVMKCFAVKKEYSGQNITGLMYKHLIQVLEERNVYHFFVFTTPENEQVFTSFNMKRIVKTMNTVLLEGGDTITNVLTNLKEEFSVSNDRKGCVIINANPLTFGHLYLIEQGAKNHKEFLVFVVSEDLSSFTFEDRFEIIKSATKHLDNVKVLPTLSYLVSKVTFPRYFLKEDILIQDEQTLVDVLVYKDFFKKIFNIETRYVGTEPFSVTTNKYNEVLKNYLGPSLKIIERLELKGKAISASQVRKYIKDNRIEELKDLVPEATYNYLLSKKGQVVIDLIQNKELTRH